MAGLSTGCGLILADRSVHTLLANSYALQCMTGTGFLAPSVRLLRSSPIPAWPDLVLYLDVPQDTIHRRNQGRFPPRSIYTARRSTRWPAGTSGDSPARNSAAPPAWMPR